MPRTSRSKHKRQNQKKENKHVTKKTAASKPGPGKEEDKPTSKYTPDQLLTKAEECMDSFDIATANLFIERALQQSPDSAPVLERAGPMLLEAGQPDAALAIFNRSAVLDDVTHLTFVYLGQLCQGLEAVQQFRRGIELLQRHSPVEGSSNDAAVSKVFCSIAELYMTDLCFEEDAQVQCESAISSALKASPGSTEALQLRASFALTCNDKQGAVEWLKKAVNPWLPGLARQRSEDQGATAQADIDLPEFDLRIKIAQLSIELEQYELASDILEQLLDEDDQVIQVWYLLGWLNHLQELWSNAAHYLTQALQLVDKADADDKELLEHAQQLLTELKPEVEEEEKVNPEEVAERIEQMSDDEELMET